VGLQVALFIISTTGNGDAPENAEKFWRFVKRRTHPKDMLAKMQYSVLVSQPNTARSELCQMDSTRQPRR
jgi:methionine synthase reductase